MRTKPNAKKNTTPTVTCTAPWRLVEIIPLEDFKLKVKFVDGTCGLVEIKRLIMSKKAGIFAKLRDVNIFNQVYLVCGVATWEDEIDLAPDTMHDEIKRNGVCTL